MQLAECNYDRLTYRPSFVMRQMRVGGGSARRGRGYRGYCQAVYRPPPGTVFIYLFAVLGPGLLTILLKSMADIRYRYCL